MRRLAHITAALSLAALGVVLVLPVVLYCYGLSLVPAERFAIEPVPVPARADTILWASLGGRGEASLRSQNPYTALWVVFLRLQPGAVVTFEADERLAGLASRVILPRGTRLGAGDMGAWHLATASVEIWVGRHWSPREASAAFLREAGFAHGFVGIESAAMGYFGVSPDELTDGQLATLAGVSLSSRRDPWCFPEKSRAAARRVLHQLGNLAEDPATGLLPEPPGACQR